MKRLLFVLTASLALPAATGLVAQTQTSPVTAIRAGRLVDPETGTRRDQPGHPRRERQVHGRRAATSRSRRAREVIDLSKLTVLPGLVDAHNHLALTYKEVPERNIYYLTYVLDSTPLRAIQAVSNGIQMLSSGFTIVRDMGNNGNYADIALRVGDRAGLDPGTDDHQLGDHHRRHGRTVLPDARDGEGPQHRLPGVPRRRHAGRDREGRAPEHAVRREGDQDLRRLQAVGLHASTRSSSSSRSGEGGAQGRRPRADRRRARGARSRRASGRSRTTTA